MVASVGERRWGRWCAVGERRKVWIQRVWSRVRKDDRSTSVDGGFVKACAFWESVWSWASGGRSGRCTVGCIMDEGGIQPGFGYNPKCGVK